MTPTDREDYGWSGIATGITGANERDVELRGGWPEDTRPLWMRCADMLAWNGAVILGVLALMVLLTLLAR